MSTQVEIWRVSTVEGVFEADLETLKQWIAEGCVLPTDKVTKGSLNWIEAGKAPMLRAAFSGEARTIEPATTTTVPEAKDPLWSDNDLQNHQDEFVVAPADSLSHASPASVCHEHPERKTEYVCHVCVKSFCKDCVKTLSGGKITLCPVCGDLCRVFEQEQIKVTSQEFQSSGFGFGDFTRALRYPFQHKLALLFGAVLYAILLFGGFRGRVLASVILFGCISQVISQVAWGRLNRSFMPELGSFSPWDDLFVPLGLGIGVTIVSWGPTIILLLVLVFGAIGGPALPPSTGVQGQNEDTSSQLSSEDLDVLLDPNGGDPKKVEEANKKLQQLRPGHQISQDAERSQMELNDPTADLRFFASYFQGSIFILLLLLVSVVWGIFYYPMALAVAGYTESFGSVINPLIGLDTIRRMGGTYFKAFGMVLLIQFGGFVLSIITAIITAPFALPFFGNLPAMFIDGSMTFYFNLVIACILGLALHKCADRVGIELT